jgi:uncharacterized protein (TIGR03435 family)
MVVAMSAQTSKPTFAVASVKKQPAQIPPSRPPSGTTQSTTAAFRRLNATVVSLVRFAYGIMDFQVIGGPEWAREDLFEINARAGGPATSEQMQPMVQSLLEDRFKLVVRREQREMRTSALVLARDDGRLGPQVEKCDDPANLPPPKPIRVPPGASLPYSVRCGPISNVASLASALLKMPVVDRSGVTGLWTYTLVFLQLEPLPPGLLRDLADRENVPPFATALRDQLGLKLESGRGPVDVLVIDSVQQPTPN